MSEISIVPVHTDAPEAAAFIALPHRIYQGDANWVPWFHRGMRRILTRRHPYFAHSQGEFFVARRGGVRARILLLEPRRYNEYHGRRDARFFLFDAFDDREATTALFSFARQWARDRGLNRLVGPQGFSSFGGAGILVHGFDQRAMMTMMPYHKAYYPKLIEAAGFAKLRDFYSASIDGRTQTLPEAFSRAAAIARKRGTFTVARPRTRRDLRRIAAGIGELYNASWEEHDDFTPLTRAEMDGLTGDLLLVSRADLVKVVYHGDDIAGFVLAFPDVSKSLIRAKGRLTMRTLLDIRREKRRTRRYAINGLGILPRYRKSAVLPLLFTEITGALTAAGLEHAEIVQIAETTDLMMSNLNRLNAPIYKTHRVYETTL